ncbi:MAG: FAD-dependent oxidoreductase [Gammaproteobacteria bacterium]|nr:FAD-dependent oxidoreductase [Gammaproteobacteria bacterium]MBI5617230.1 FAD-dependent oxidoreductase [Gammaproteobacteria bacterium]
MTAYPKLFTPWNLRNAEIRNKVVFPPTCPSWTSDPWTGVFTDMATSYYEERAKGGVGLIIIGGTHVHPSSLSAPLLLPQLHSDNAIGPLSKVADAVHAHGCKLAIQLFHSGMRGYATYKQVPGYDPDATWYTLSPSQVPLGEFPGASTPKALEEHEIEEILQAYASAAKRAMAAGLDGVELHLSHGYLPWQFLSPLYNHRTDRWGGSYENRLRFPVECLRRIRAAIGPQPFLGYRINSTSFWPGDLEIDDVQRIVKDIESRVDVDYVNVSAGVHHTFIHTPMEFQGGWERGYARKIKDVSAKPVFLVGRITMPDVAEHLLEAGDADAICLARQLFTDPEWANKAKENRANDIRACVAANFCWKSVSRGGRVQCVYNPTVGREGEWGAGTLVKVAEPKRALVIGAGPAGLEYARVAAARGHHVTVLEAQDATGGHVRVHALLPSRTEFGEIGRWLGDQAQKNGAVVKTGAEVTAANLDAVLAEYAPDHVVVATGSKSAVDGFQGWTAAGLPGWETGNCITWEELIQARAATPPRSFPGHAVVIDDLGDVAGPLTAVALAEGGASSVTLVTRWPMVGMETLLDVYFEWIMPRVYKAGVRVLADHFVKEIDGETITLYNVHHEEARQTLPADWIVMATGRRSENALYHLLRDRGVSTEMIGDSAAPRYTYEAVYEGHRQARKL